MKLPPELHKYLCRYCIIPKEIANKLLIPPQIKMISKYLVDDFVYYIPVSDMPTNGDANSDEIDLCIKIYRMFRTSRGAKFVIDISRNNKMYRHFMTLVEFVNKLMSNYPNCSKLRANVYQDYFTALYRDYEERGIGPPQIYQLGTQYAQSTFLSWIEENYPGGTYFSEFEMGGE
jgi:hypothetical protein